MERPRIDAIDTLKGVSMIMIWYTHFMIPWHMPDWEQFFRMQWVVIDFFGPSMFVALSTIGIMLSTRKRFARGDRRLLTLDMGVKVSFLLVVGELLNIPWYLDGPRLVNWNVVTTVAVFSLLVPAIMRIPRPTRLALVLVIALTYFPFLEWANGGFLETGTTLGTMRLEDLQNPKLLVYFLFLFPSSTTPVYSWLLVPLLSSVVFDPFTRHAASDDVDGMRGELKMIAVSGIALVATGVLLGTWLIPGVSWHVGTFTAFLTRHTPQNLMYNLGILCIMFAAVGSFQATHRKLPFQDHVNAFGRHSLTAFIGSHAGMTIGFITNGSMRLPYIVFLIVVVASIIAAVNVLYFWSRDWKGKGTLEWLLQFYTSAVVRVIHKELPVLARPATPVDR